MSVAAPRFSPPLPPEKLNGYPNPKINCAQPCLDKIDSIHVSRAKKEEVDSSEHPIEALFGLLMMIALLGFYSAHTLTTAIPFGHSPARNVPALNPNQPY